MITTQVVDTARGVAAPRIPVELDFFITGHGWKEAGHGITNHQGRIEDFGEPPAAGIYRLMFDVEAHAAESYFPSITITFEIRNPAESHHIALAVSPYGYSVHRA